MRRVAFVLATLALTGCAQKMVYLLADGRVPGNDAVLNQQFEMDRIACNEEMSSSVPGGDHRDGGLTRGVEVEQAGNDCMAERGYVSVQQDQVAAKQQQLAAIAAANAQRDAAAAAAPSPPPSAPPRRIAGIKPKPQPSPSSAAPSQN